SARGPRHRRPRARDLAHRAKPLAAATPGAPPLGALRFHTPGSLACATPQRMSLPLRFEGMTLTVADVERSLAFYEGKLGLHCEVRAAPNFAMLRVGDGTIGLLSLD